LAGFIGLKGLG